MANILVPLLLGEMAETPPIPADKFAAFYLRKGALRLRLATGKDQNVVLDQPLVGYRIAAPGAGRLLVTDTVTQALAKLDARLNEVEELTATKVFSFLRHGPGIKIQLSADKQFILISATDDAPTLPLAGYTTAGYAASGYFS